MGINADGTVRLITDEGVTAIPWGAAKTALNWDGSHAKDWLNNYFYPRLKGNDIIVEQTWCSEATTDENSARTTCTNNLSKEPAKAGLMTIDEYNLSGGKDSYLNNLNNQRTMTPANSYYVWYIYEIPSTYWGDADDSYVLRAVINIKSDSIISGGNGVISENWSNELGPYVLNNYVEEKEKLSDQATSGEYVLFAGKKYRVVDKDSNGNTKLMLDGYYEEPLGTAYEMSFGENNEFTTASGIGKKLNTDVLEWLVASDDIINRNKLVTNYTWYQNNFAKGDNYKVSLNEINATRSIQATVGLIRVGEMMSGQSSSVLTRGYKTPNNYNNTNTYWTMITYNSSNAWNVNFYSYGANNNDVSDAFGLRAVIVVNSDVTITKGNGTWSNPYQI